METHFQVGTPNAVRRGTGGISWLVCGSVFSFLPTVALLAIFLGVPQSARAQQGPRWNPPNPQSNFPQNSSTTEPDVGNTRSTDPFESMDGGAGMIALMPIDNSRLINAESCQTWTAAAVDSPTVSVARLEVPGKASHEFQKACGDFKDHKLKSGEDHARKAVKIYPGYAAAWVLLGEILRADHKDQEAIEACRSAESADPKYAPPYICLAGFAASANDWDEAYSLADHALSLDPATDPYAYLYTATADFHLRHIDQAELYAKSAEKLDKWNRVPEVHILLAQIYEVKGRPAEEASELRKFLKDSPHTPDWETAKSHLAEIEKRVGN